MFEDKLYHHGIKGQKWGVRRFRNKVGSQTSADKKREQVDGVQTKEDRKQKTKRILAKTAAKGVKIVSKLLTASIVDDVFYGGAGKETIKTLGRATVTAVLMARGHTDIKWYDKYGRRVG